MKGLLLIALLIGGLEVRAQELKLNLEDCISLAINNSTAVANAKLDSDVTAAQLLQSYGQFLPNLTASSTVNSQVGNTYITGTTPINVQTNDYGGVVQLTSSVNLFNGFADSLGLKAALSRNEASHLGLSWAKEQITLDVTQAFFQAALSRELFKTASENLEISRTQQEALKHQIRIGVRTIVDLRRQEAQTSIDEVSLANAKNHARQDMISLMKRLRIETSRQIELIYSSQVKKSFNFARKEDELVKQALSRRDDLKAANLSIEAAMFGIGAARAVALPKLDFNLSLGDSFRTFIIHNVNGPNAVPNPQDDPLNQMGDHINYVFGVTLTWNVFDRSLTKTNEQLARVAARRSQLAIQDLVATIESDVQRAYSDLSAAVSQIAVTEMGLRAASEAFELLQERYLLGKGSFTDVLAAQSVQLQAKTARAQAIFSYQLQEHTIKTLIGESR